MQKLNAAAVEREFHVTKTALMVAEAETEQQANWSLKAE